MSLEKIVYEAEVKVTGGGRDGHATSSDGVLDLDMSVPEAMGGAGGSGSNPEQLFAAGFSACFTGALNLVAGQEKVDLPEGTHVVGQVGIGPHDKSFAIQATMNVHLPGMDQARAEDLVAKTHEVCPYSKATRGNIDVTLNTIV